MLPKLSLSNLFFVISFFANFTQKLKEITFFMKCKPLLTMDTVKKELAHINKHSSMTQVIPIYINGELLVKPLFHYQFK